MPKHTIEIPCSAGDKIKVIRYYFTHKADVATVTAVMVHESGDDIRIKVKAVTADNQSRLYEWGKSAFALEETE